METCSAIVPDWLYSISVRRRASRSELVEAWMIAQIVVETVFEFNLLL